MGNSHPDKYSDCKVCESFEAISILDLGMNNELKEHMKSFIGKRYIFLDQCAHWKDKNNISNDNIKLKIYQIRADVPGKSEYRENYIPTITLNKDQDIVDISYSNVEYENI
jgi:hypothetical protein